MASPLCALIADCNHTDALKAAAEFHHAGYDLTYQVVANTGDFQTALQNGPWDVIISDLYLADFTGLEALEILALEAVESPVIIFAETIPDGMAINAMRRGARDCITKDNLKRLVPVVEREIKTARHWQAHQRVERDGAAYRRQLEELVRNLPVGVYRRTPGPDGQFVMANPMIARIFGYETVSDFMQCNFADLFAKKTAREYSNAKIVRDGKVEGEILRLRRRDGTQILGLVTAHAVRDNKGDIEFIDGIIEDCTQRKVSEEAMIQSEKMISVGGLAAGMAHEINNPLAAIMQNAALLQMRLTRDVPDNHQGAARAGTSLAAIQAYTSDRGLPELLARIQDASRRAADIVKNTLHFSRKSTAQVTPNNLAEVLDRTLALAETDYNLKKNYDFKQIKIVREYDPTLPPVLCEESKLQQVFLNLLSNGAKAMAAETQTRAPQFNIKTSRDGEMARVDIADNGPGMDAKTCRRVFEPFFTTSPTDEGTGLGLSVSHFIITDNHKGKIGVHSTPGQGANFFIKLPL